MLGVFIIFVRENFGLKTDLDWDLWEVSSIGGV